MVCDEASSSYQKASFPPDGSVYMENKKSILGVGIDIKSFPLLNSPQCPREGY
jgi:hypothetical protein